MVENRTGRGIVSETGYALTRKHVGKNEKADRVTVMSGQHDILCYRIESDDSVDFEAVQRLQTCLKKA